MWRKCSSHFLTLGLSIDYVVCKKNWISKSKIFTFQFDSVRFESDFSYLYVIEVSSVEESDHTSTLEIFHLFYRLRLGDSWAMILDPESEKNNSPLKLFVFTAICKKCFIACQTTNTNILPLSNLELVYFLIWKESAIWKSCCLLWGSDCVLAACSWLSFS